MNPLAKHKCAINLHLAAYSMILLASSRDLWKFHSLMSRKECKSGDYIENRLNGELRSVQTKQVHGWTC